MRCRTRRYCSLSTPATGHRPRNQDLGSSEIEFKRTMSALLAYSLVESRQDMESYSVHPVVHDWCAETISDNRVDFLMLAFLVVGFAVPSNAERGYWLLQQRLIPHAEHCTRQSHHIEIEDATDYSERNDAFHNLGHIYADQGKLAEAEEMYQRALDGKEKAWGAEHTSTKLYNASVQEGAGPRILFQCVCVIRSYHNRELLSVVETSYGNYGYSDEETLMEELQEA